MVQKVMGKTKTKKNERHAFDGVTTESELTEQQVNMLKREARKRKWVRRINWCSDRIQALFWVAVSGLIIYKTNFFRQLWENDDISPMFMALTLVCLGINVMIMLYVTVGMPLKGQEADIEKVPKLIPVMSIASVLMPIFLVIAIWPIWGILSIIYVFVLSFGYIFALSFLPGGRCGTLLFWLIVLGLATLSHLIPHANHDSSW
uniref:Transmembrane protein n=1 Tax=Strombidium inclinatum TaxID=197538 RepID=A0A7S3IZ80_9SPIT